MVWLALTLLAAVASQTYAATNVAQGKTATQSSIWSVTNPSSYAVDGDTSSTFRIGGHCAQTGMEDGPYVMVDLGASYVIDSVELWTREKNMGSSYAERDKDMEIRIGNSPYHMNNPVCTKFNGLVPVKAVANCAAAACGRYLSIQRMASGYNYMHVCEIKAFANDPTPGCVDPDAYSGVCRCSGDPHCQSFDGSWLHFQGACLYTLARDNCASGATGTPSWEVIANFDREGSSFSYVRQIIVNLNEDDLVIEMLQDREVKVNGVTLLGSPKTYNDKVTISVTPNQVYLAVEGGIRVVWDGSSIAQVEVQDSAKGKVCGICGNFDGNADNDWTIGPAETCMTKYPDAEAGETTDDTNVMGTSWTAGIDEEEGACAKECPNPLPPVPPVDPCLEDDEAADHCAPLKDPSGPFKDCIAKMSAVQLEDMYMNCVYDACYLDDYVNPICEHGASMAMVCQGQFEVTVEWRSGDLCAPDCGENMEFLTCGDACVPTCSDLTGENCGDLGPCTEGCFCKDGFVFDQASGACIDTDECGCKVPGEDIYIPVGESYISDECAEKCACLEEQGEIECTELECPTNEVCGIADGAHGCQCLPPFVKLDGECVDLPYPCEDGDETQDLLCLTCKNAGSYEECAEKGTMETCTGADPICSTEITKNIDQEIKKLNRGCSTRKSCSDASIGPGAEDCNADGGKTACSNCGYGEEADGLSSCLAPTEPPTTVPGTTEAPVDVCTLNKDVGEGSASQKRWYFKISKCKCTSFTFKGSGGNENNFGSKADCEAACSVFDTPEDCKLEKDPGPCDKFKKWYFFDVKKNKCKKFNYGGCDGNANLFKKKDDCRTKCKRC